MLSTLLFDDAGLLTLNPRELERDLNVAEDALVVVSWLRGLDGGRMIGVVIDPGSFIAFVLSEGSVTLASAGSRPLDGPWTLRFPYLDLPVVAPVFF